MLKRQCSRTACRGAAVATLTYVHADRTAVLGPLATYAEPHTYDLCADHTTRMTAPRGWNVVRLAIDLSEPEPTPDDLLALADAVRAAGSPQRSRAPEAPSGRPTLTVVPGLPGQSPRR
ncbi:DUF3499 domain-containing protein [Rudaeicoccus suwonensis]|uniref:Uncharacterized protein DUF3499 n=1 Tax=Rudaeicoccus suwonensis TaxID=657409 RepID=A0A561E936_9MICO|nr:DUF3499 domain-containing protein [Rudaeicoccus suwonensis]TWE12135.1 uncharacterized protein DUF3499 [Rudaeicoccus suwonensis]